MDSRYLFAAVLAAGFVGAVPAQATNGYFAHGQGAVSKGMAGAGVTLGEGPVAMAQNPALGVSLGNVAGADATLFMPDRQATFNTDGGAVTPGTYESENGLFLIPSGGVNYMVTPDTSVGLVLYGNGGMNTEYNSALFANFGAGTAPTGVDLSQVFLSVNVAHQVMPGVTIGIAPVLALQTFEAYGLEAFAGMSADPMNVTNKGHDWSYGGGVKAGVLWDVNKWFSIGASYQSRMWMTKFEDYAGLFADGGAFDIPASVSSGIAIRPMRNLAVLLEHQRIFYGDVDSIALSSVSTSPLGSANGPGFGWDDMDVFRIAVQWQVDDQWTLRTGFSHATQFAEDSEVLFNTLAPATIRNHLSFGASWKATEKVSLHLAYTYAFREDVTGSTAALMGTQTETLSMVEHEVSLGLSYRF